jgi:hypothetical protein
MGAHRARGAGCRHTAPRPSTSREPARRFCNKKEKTRIRAALNTSLSERGAANRQARAQAED